MELPVVLTLFFVLYLIGLAEAQRECEKGCLNNVCNSTNGVCSDGCRAGFYGQRCDRECEKGCIDNACNSANGVCSEGCRAGFYGQRCDSECGRCRNKPCDKRTGRCTEGCEAGWGGSLCDRECEPFTFGPDCIFPCGSCFNNESCSSENGECPLGCEDGWRIPYCKMPCPTGFYGVNCSNICGFCRLVTQCDAVTGRCSDGCVEGYYEPLCKYELLEFSFLALPFIIAGSTVGVIYILVMSICICHCWRARKRRSHDMGLEDEVASEFESADAHNANRRPIESESPYDVRFLNRLDNLMSFKGQKRSKHEPSVAYRKTQPALPNHGNGYRDSEFSDVDETTPGDYVNVKNVGHPRTSGGLIYANGILIENKRKEAGKGGESGGGYANVLHQYINLNKPPKPGASTGDYQNIDPDYTQPSSYS
ncbi:scavenger receptor class F member 1 [Patella vulgata]|uniref:scavenger receptor class F member 1 n=1 Tax=Patella vulgata TaxID=6465 RepID=UPI00217F89F8|nr:scavenger receptor class F member 1 [Patella vulgata]